MASIHSAPILSLLTTVRTAQAMLFDTLTARRYNRSGTDNTHRYSKPDIGNGAYAQPIIHRSPGRLRRQSQITINNQVGDRHSLRPSYNSTTDINRRRVTAHRRSYGAQIQSRRSAQSITFRQHDQIPSLINSANIALAHNPTAHIRQQSDTAQVIDNSSGNHGDRSRQR